MIKKILLVTDAWQQVNGVVTTLENLVKQLETQGLEVRVLSHADAKIKCAMPLYPEVTLAWISQNKIQSFINWADAIHISTPEGPIGLRALRYCVKHKLRFTTGYHTKWPDFIYERTRLPRTWVANYMRWLHKHSVAVLVPTKSVSDELADLGFRNLKVWTRGVDRTCFQPLESRDSSRILLCVSRLSHEKNLEAFCEIHIPGYTKMLVGDGPYRKTLEKKYPDVEFTGTLRGTALARVYAEATVFVFPSKTDTFGVVMIESMATGTPVAAYPVTGPLDVIKQGVTGIYDQDLTRAVLKALALDRDTVYTQSLDWSWQECAEQFMNALLSKE